MLKWPNYLTKFINNSGLLKKIAKIESFFSNFKYDEIDQLDGKDFLDFYNKTVVEIFWLLWEYKDIKEYIDKNIKNAFLINIESIIVSLNNKLSVLIDENESYFTFSDYLENIGNLKNIDVFLEEKNNWYLYQVPYLPLFKNWEEFIYFNLSQKEKIEKLDNNIQELIALSVNENIKISLYGILSNPKISDEEKVKLLDLFFRENIENLYFFPLREKVSDEFWKIFAYHTIWYDLFEKLVKKENWNYNKNIRLYFIKYYPDISTIIEFVEENEIWFRSTIAFLDRLKEEIEKTNNQDYISLYKTYRDSLFKLVKKREKENDLEYKQFIENHKDFYEKIDTKWKLVENFQYKENSNKKKDIYSLIKNWARFADIKDMLGTIKGEENILKVIKAIFEQYPVYIIKIALKNNLDLKNIPKKNIEPIIYGLNNVNKILKIVSFMEKENNFKFDRYKLLEKIIPKINNFYEIVNIMWNPLFTDFKLEIIKNNNLNKKDARLFFRLLLKSWKENIIFQSICPFITEDEIERINEQKYTIRILDWIIVIRKQGKKVLSVKI